MATGYSSKILALYYVPMADFELATGKSFNEGDLITDADVAGASGLVWQQLAINNPVSDFKFVREPLTAEQYSEYNRDDLSQIGFHKAEGKITRIHDNSFSTTHKELLKNMLGNFVAKQGESDTVDVTARNTDTITQTSSAGISSSNEGKFIKVGENICVVKSVSGTTITVENKINVTAGDSITDLDYYELDEVGNEPYLLFIKTAKENHLVTWARFGLDFETPANQLLNLVINFQGDKANITSLKTSTIGTIIAETATQHMTTTNFKGISVINSDAVCAGLFNFKLTREMTRMECQATESSQGNGGTHKDKYTTEITLTMYSSAYSTEYEANDFIEVLGQKDNFAIWCPGALIRSEDTNVVNNDIHQTTYVIAGNVDASKKMLMVL